MTTDEVRQILERNGLQVKTCARTGNDDGNRIDCASGEIINVFDSGRVSVQGKNAERIKQLLGIEAGGRPTGSTTRAVDLKREVFVVYGHDTIARTQLEAMLRRWNINPLILDQLPSEGLTLIEKLEKYSTDQVPYAIVLATPDDEGHAKGRTDEKKFRARQNVVLELGMMLAKLGRSRVAILLKDQKNMERPTDIDGVVYLPFQDSVEEAKELLAKELHNFGITIDVSKL